MWAASELESYSANLSAGLRTRRFRDSITSRNFCPFARVVSPCYVNRTRMTDRPVRATTAGSLPAATAGSGTVRCGRLRLLSCSRRVVPVAPALDDVLPHRLRALVLRPSARQLLLAVASPVAAQLRPAGQLQAAALCARPPASALARVRVALPGLARPRKPHRDYLRWERA